MGTPVPKIIVLISTYSFSFVFLVIVHPLRDRRDALINILF
jgi:hypothetical protein